MGGFGGGGRGLAADKPIGGGPKIVITAPQNGDTVRDRFELKYEFPKGFQAIHAHVFVDNEYQRGFTGTFKGLAKETHQITVIGATRDHARVAASQLAGNEVAGFVHMDTPTKLKVTGIDLVSLGHFAEGQDRQDIVLRDAAAGR